MLLMLLMLMLLLLLLLLLLLMLMLMTLLRMVLAGVSAVSGSLARTLKRGDRMASQHFLQEQLP
jgi:hypothetical protein